MANLFILGAGFSKPAGLPLGFELFPEILKIAKQRDLYENTLKPDIKSFLNYFKGTTGTEISEDKIDLEKFVSFLDIQHFLQLKGKDHWSSRGNLSQLIIKKLIASILHEREQAISEASFALYEEFAKKLGKDDWIITFNYDTVLERALTKKSIPYRLFPTRYKSISFGGGEVDNRDEIVLLKMHGSINWFDISHHDKEQQSLREHPLYLPPRHGVFGNGKNLPLEKILTGPYPQESPLHDIYQTNNLSTYLAENSFWEECPLIISPSFTKMIYLNPLAEFWRGLEREGIYTKQVSIIGFSLPMHDEYIAQPLYSIVNNFQNIDPGVDWLKKAKLKMVDFRRNKSEVNKYKKGFPFVDWEKADCYFGGFNEKALDMIFG